MSELWVSAGGRVLNDDRIGLRPQPDGTVMMYGTPWHGTAKYASPEAVPLAGIYFIEHAAENRRTRLVGVEAVAQLLAFTFFPLFDAGQIARTQETAEAILVAVPCYRLGFVPDASAVGFVLKG